MSCDTRNCIVDEGGDFRSRYNVPGLRYGAAMCHDKTLGAATRMAASATRRAVHVQQRLGLRYKFCIVTRRGLRHDFVSRHSPTTRCPCATTRPRYGWAHARYGREGGHDTATVCHDTTGPASSVRAAWTLCARSLGSGCAPCAPNPVLTQDTVLSHCWGHCS